MVDDLNKVFVGAESLQENNAANNNVIETTAPVLNSFIPDASGNIAQNNIPIINPIIIQGAPEKNKSLLLKISLAVLLLVLIALVFILVKGNSSATKYGLDSNEADNSSSEVSTTIKKTSYVTSVQYDKIYEDVSIKSNSDVLGLIKKDSIGQKEICGNSDITAIESQIESYGVDAVNLCEMDITLAEEIAQSVKDVFDRYPNAKGFFTNLSLGNMSSDMSNAYAFAGPSVFAIDNQNSSVGEKIYIIMNSKIFLNVSKLEKSIKGDVSAKFHPANFKRADVIVHELGHYLTFMLTMRKNNVFETKYLTSNNQSAFFSAMQKWNENDKNIVERAYSNYVSGTNPSISFDDFRATISGYAMAKDDNGDYIYSETIAEGFTDVMINKDDAVAASKEIVKILDQDMKGLK